jgi:diadenosine tetraphosphate (Ap4A) HIT family hydrolase
MAGPDCLECAVVRNGVTPQGGPVLRRGPFVVHMRPDPAPVPGWLLVAPARHVEQIDALDATEQRLLGPLLSEAAAALRAETGAAKVYVSVFAELMPHLHVHVVARPPDLPESERGPRIFASERRADPAEALAVARRVHARLRGPAPPRTSAKAASESRWRPLLLSALVLPGLGQLATGRWVKGALLAGTSLVAVVFLLARVSSEALRRMPTDPLDFDLGTILGMAEAIRADNAAFFSGVTFLIVALWLIAILDAWLAQR